MGSDRLPLILFTGFLGSGKTTLLNRLLREPAFADSGVVVNEIGAIGLDHWLMEGAGDDMRLLEGGCLCCALGEGLPEAVQRLLQRRQELGAAPLQRILVETSGAASPLPLLQQVLSHPFLARNVSLEGVVTLVDGVLGTATLERHEEAREQAAVADLLVLSKADLTRAADQEALESSLDGLNERAPRITSASRNLARRILGLGSSAPERPPLPPADPLVLPGQGPHRQGLYRSHSRALPGPVAAEALEQWLDEIMAFGGAGLLRLKGIVALEGESRPLVIQAVQHLIHPPLFLDAWPDGLPGGRVTIVQRGLEGSLVEDALDWLAAEATPDVR